MSGNQRYSQQIERDRQAVSYGVLGILVVKNVPLEKTVVNKYATELLPTKIAHTHSENEYVNDPYVGAFLPIDYWMQQEAALAAMNRLAGMLVGSTRETLREIWFVESLYKIEEFQFLRRVRNGIFHNNHFDFSQETFEDKSDEDFKRKSEWRGNRITPKMEGERVFTDIEKACFKETPQTLEGFMETGDAFALVRDIIELLKERDL